MTQVVIMAGGQGTRIRSISELPKPLIPVAGVPVLEREILCLREQGFSDFVLTVCHQHVKIQDYFGDGSKLSVRINYFVEEVPLGTAGALFRMREILKGDFLLLNGDMLFDVDFNRMLAFHKEHGAVATIFAHPNSHPYDSGLLIIDQHNRVQEWLSKEDKRPTWYRNLVNGGLHILSSRVLDNYLQNNKLNCTRVDLDRDLLKPLSGMGQLNAYRSPEYVHDMGTPERFAQAEKDIQSGLIKRKNLRQKQKAIFLDRDGTINTYIPFLHKIEEFNLIEGVGKAISAINASGYLAIVVTNQPVIARGELTFEELDEMHKKMETLLGNEGAYLDAIYVCPHHTDKGFAGEIAELKCDCECRKPKPGMLLQAAKDWNIDLRESWLIGDSDQDIEAGKSAGCQSIKLDKENNLSDAIDNILKRNNYGN